MQQILTQNAHMGELLGYASRVARRDFPVLIYGETGTGKELLAHYIHHESARGLRPFIAINCTAFPESLWESELFGYERGAFTGALEGHAGKFEQADTGTIFLDEVSEMPLALQAKLLRVLQEREVDRLGSRKPRPINIRVIAASNRDLYEMVGRGTFREDLFYRLAVIPLTIPPLRDRRDDIPLLTTRFCERYGGTCSALAIDALGEYDWPGNVRELQNVIQRAIVAADGETIRPEHLSFVTWNAGPSPRKIPAFEPSLTLEEIITDAMRVTVAETNYNYAEAARRLCVNIKTLKRRVPRASTHRI